MVNTTFAIGFISIFCGILALTMLFAKDAITSALSLLGILLGTAAIYGLMGEHFIATIQLVVYAGAIMVLFVFSIMLLNIKKAPLDFELNNPRFVIALISSLSIMAVGSMGLKYYVKPTMGTWSNEKISGLGGNTKVLAHELFAHHFVSFEAISIALMVALIGAVVLAKRKVN